jgi:hypothetical protein
VVTTRYVVCKAEQLLKDDLMLEPWSGVLARVREVEQLKTGLRRLRITLLVAMSPVTLELHPGRLLRRQLRKGEVGRGDPA